MEITRDYEVKLKLSELINNKRENNEIELNKLLNAFDDISNIKTKKFIDKIQIEEIVNNFKVNHLEVMKNFSNKIIENNDDFEETDQGIAKDLS